MTIDEEIPAGELRNRPAFRGSRALTLLGRVGDPEKHSLDYLLKKAISEGEKFRQWRVSGEPLDNIRFFQRIDDQLIPILEAPEASVSGSFDIRLRIRMIEKSQFEIWKCDESRRRLFPLYRLALRDLLEIRNTVFEQRLSEKIKLKVTANRENDFVSLRVKTRDATVAGCPERPSMIDRLAPVGIFLRRLLRPEGALALSALLISVLMASDPLTGLRELNLSGVFSEMRMPLIEAAAAAKISKPPVENPNDKAARVLKDSVSKPASKPAGRAAEKDRNPVGPDVEGIEPGPGDEKVAANFHQFRDEASLPVRERIVKPSVDEAPGKVENPTRPRLVETPVFPRYFPDEGNQLEPQKTRGKGTNG